MSATARDGAPSVLWHSQLLAANCQLLHLLFLRAASKIDLRRTPRMEIE